MGGNLFHFPRMPRRQYLAVEGEMRRYLQQLLPGQYRIPRYYDDKADFGDMDILVAERADWNGLRKRIVHDLGITQTKTVGHVFSTVFRDLQTDFFLVPPRYLESTYNFMSFNDLGNFLGRMFRRFNLKYGDRGLVYVYRRADNRYKADLEVTRDFARIAGFLGVDYAKWQAGFASLAEIFEWVIASPYFSVAPYLDEAEGSIAARRGERTTVMRFVEWLNAHNFEKRPVFDDRQDYLPMVVAAFPEADLPGQIAAERTAEERQMRFAAKFNGNRVMDLTGLSGPALGELIVAIKASEVDFESFVLAREQQDIDARIRAIAEKRNGT